MYLSRVFLCNRTYIIQLKIKYIVTDCSTQLSIRRECKGGTI
nr:MAG TPA: hypothetical protein [Crassvirales sp.]